MRYQFNNKEYKFAKSGESNSGEYIFYASNGIGKQGVTLAFKEKTLVIDGDTITIDANKKESQNGVMYWVNYQEVDTSSVAYQKNILSRAKGISEEMTERIFSEHENDFRTIDEMCKFITNGGKVKGIGKRKAESISEQLKKAVEDEFMNTLIFLCGFKNAQKISENIYELEELYKEPYKVMHEAGVGFRTSDEIAIKNLGVSLSNQERIFYLVHYKYNEFGNFNQKCSNYIDFEEFRAFLLSQEDLKLHTDVDTFIKENELLVVENKRVYLGKVYSAENEAPKILKSMQQNFRKDIENINNSIELYQNDNGLQLDELQKEAIVKAVSSNVCLVTGGAGTGKSTIVKGVVRVLESNDFIVVQLAPTGKASVRMTECTGKIANTIHSLVCFVKYTAKTCNDVYSQLEKKFGILSRSANGTYIIVDEFSMVDQCLLYDLLSCINELNSTYRTRIIGMIVIGDTSQLPSVGRGSVLGDMVGAKVFEHVHLTKTYRQKGNSNILDNANNVRNMQSIKFMREKDFYCSEYDDETLKKYINHFKSKYDNDLDFYKNVQVCTFLNATCKKVALICKEVLRNDSSEEYSVGDKVINCKNDKDAGISNGDMGIIENIEKKYNKKGVVTETKYVVYFYDIDIRAEITSENLKTGYCCTVHKLQGSEYKTIIIIAEKSILLEHRMLYTAITRGKENCIIMGEKSTIEKACRTSHDSKRLTFFKEKLIKEFAGEE